MIDDPPIQAAHPRVIFSRDDPIINGLQPVGWDLNPERQGRVHGPLGDGASLELAILRIPPGALEILKFLYPGRIRVDSRTVIPHPTHQKIAVFFIVNDRFFIRIVISGVTDRGFEDVKILVEKEAEFSFPVLEIFQNDLLDVDIVPVIHEVIAVEPKAQVLVGGDHMGDKGFVGIGQMEIPTP
jgi:hypothetical protein